MQLNGKQTRNVQFYKELLSMEGDETQEEKSRLKHEDELEMERRERKHIRKLCKEFSKFVDALEELSKLTVDVP